MEYQKIFKALDDHKIRYIVCGGLAMNIYGIPRMTVDIDLLLDFTKDNIESFQKILADLKYKPVLPVNLDSFIDVGKRKEAIDSKNMIVYSYYNQISNFMQLDVLLDVPLSFEVMWQRKAEIKSGDIAINLVSVDDLIKMKEYSNRIQDRDDIALLTKFIKR